VFYLLYLVQHCCLRGKDEMNKILLFILLPVLLTVSGEFLLKATINHQMTKDFQYECANSASLIVQKSEIGVAEKLVGIGVQIKKFVSNPLIVLAALLIVIGGILWVVAMSKFELSFIYPFLSLNYIVIIIGSALFLGEKVTLTRYLSVVLISIGLIIISRSPYSESTTDK
jgi:uncharacterized membrane protein